MKTRENLAVFIRDLRADLARDPKQWENPDLDRYLGGLAAVVEDLEGRFMHRGESVPPEPSWRLIAELLDAAVVYE